MRDPGEPAWLSVSPGSGSSTGQADPTSVTVSYLPDVAGLAIGPHTATITVSDPAAQTPVETVSVLLQVKTVLPDLDQDGDVDQTDFGMLQVCYAQTGISPGCEAANFNHDTVIGTADFAAFHGCLSGSGVVASHACDDAYE